MPENKIKTSPAAKALGDKQKSKIKNSTPKKAALKTSTTKKVAVKTEPKIASSKVTKKASPKPAKAVKTLERTVEVKTTRPAGLSVSVFGLDGAKKGTVSLPKEMFGAKINNALMAQAVRVYQVNQRQVTASTKTRGDVIGSTRKIYRQKGTGRARHGAIKAPIFVGGGVALGPHPRNFELKLSKQMKKKALFSALSQKLTDEKVFIVDATQATGKTKEVYTMLKALNVLGKKKDSNILFVSDSKNAETRAARNIGGLTVEPAQNLNTYQVLRSNALVLAKSSIEALEKAFSESSK